MGLYTLYLHILNGTVHLVWTNLHLWHSMPDAQQLPFNFLSNHWWLSTHLCPFSKSKFNLKSDRVNLVLLSVCFIYTQCPGDTVQTGTGKVDPARKFKCTTTVRVRIPKFSGWTSSKIYNALTCTVHGPPSTYNLHSTHRTHSTCTVYSTQYTSAYPYALYSTSSTYTVYSTQYT